MAGYGEGLEFSKVKDIQSELKKLPRELLSKIFSKGTWYYENEEYSEDLHGYSLDCLHKSEEGINFLYSFINHVKSKGYGFYLNGNKVDNTEEIAFTCFKDACEGLSIIFSGEGEPYIDSYGKPCLNMGCEDSLYNYVYSEDTTKPGDITWDIKNVTLYSASTQKDECDISYIFNEYALDSDEYIRIRVGNIILFDLDVVDYLLHTQNTNDTKYNDASLILDYIGNVTSKETNVLVKCCPCLLNDYIWSEPKDVSKGLQDLVDSFSKDESIYCIYMDDDTPNVRFNPKRSIYSYPYFSEEYLKDFADKFVGYLLDMVDFPIKEAYIVKGSNHPIKGKYICRKCKDGEYIVTLY